jgi:hypothetical protein
MMEARIEMVVRGIAVPSRIVVRDQSQLSVRGRLLALRACKHERREMKRSAPKA